MTSLGEQFDVPGGGAGPGPGGAGFGGGGGHARNPQTVGTDTNDEQTLTCRPSTHSHLQPCAASLLTRYFDTKTLGGGGGGGAGARLVDEAALAERSCADPAVDGDVAAGELENGVGEGERCGARGCDRCSACRSR